MLQMLAELRQIAESYEGNPERQAEVFMDALKEYPHVLKLMCQTIEDAQCAIRKVNNRDMRKSYEQKLRYLMIKSGYNSDMNGLD